MKKPVPLRCMSSWRHRFIWSSMLVGTLGVAQAADRFEAIRPVLEKHCIDCHGADKQKGDVRFDKFSGGPSEETELWLKVLDQLQSGEMPPKKKPRPSHTELAVLTGWIEENAGAATQAFIENMKRPENGNLVPHEKLFDPKTAEEGPKIAASPARIWRTLPGSYEAKQQAWLKERGVNVAMRNGQGKRYGYFPAPFGLHGEHELKNYSFRYSLEASQTEGLANNARGLLGLVIDVKPRGNVKTLIQDLAKSEEVPKTKELNQVITEQYIHWLGREPENAELERKRKKVEESIGKFGNREGLIFGLVPILIHPEAFYHSEFGIEVAKDQPAILTPEEIIDAIDRALRDQRHEAGRNPRSQWQIGYGNPIVRDFLQVAAEQGKLNNREDLLAALDLAKQHKRIKKLSESETVKRFLEEYFNYTEYFHVFKDIGELQKEKDAGRLFGTFAEHFNNGHPEKVVSKTRAVIDKILEEDRDVLARLLTIKTDYRGDSDVTLEMVFEKAKRGFEGGIGHLERRLAQTGENKLSDKDRERTLKDLEKRKKGLAELMEKHPDWLEPSRLGVLNQRSWLVSHSDNAENHPIHRGKWIRERLLGGRVPDVPVTVDAALPEDHSKTLRERMEKTRQAECWKCHRLMDPLGLPFEQFDHFGSVRETEKDRPIIITGEIIDSGDPKIDGPVAGPDELVNKLASSERVQQVFVRYAFRFWMGRNETLQDAKTLQDAYKAYKESGGSMSALLQSLLTSDAFLYRTGAISKTGRTKL